MFEGMGKVKALSFKKENQREGGCQGEDSFIFQPHTLKRKHTKRKTTKHASSRIRAKV